MDLAPQTKVQKYSFRCPCCEEVIFDSTTEIEKHGIRIVGQLLTFRGITYKLPPTCAFLLCTLLEAFPKALAMDSLVQAVSTHNMSDGRNRLDPEFVGRKTVDVQISRLNTRLVDSGIQIIRTQYNFYALRIPKNDSPAT